MKFRTPHSALRILLLSLLTTYYSLLSAGEVRWIGAAQDKPQITTITVANTWAAGDQATVTCNNKSVTVTCGATMDTPAEVAAGLAEALGLTHHDASKITADMTLNVGGRELGEFWDFDATVSGAVITLTSRVAGVPYTVITSETTAGDGTVGAPTTASGDEATGKHHWDNAANWHTGVVPTSGDQATFTFGAVDVLYGLANSTPDISLYRRNGYTGNIGLPDVNESVNGKSYREYRAKRLVLPITATSGIQTHEIGERTSSLPARGTTYLDFGQNDGTLQELVVYDAPQANSQTGAGVQFYGGNDLDLYVYRGSVACGDGLATEGTSLGILQVKYLTNQANDAHLHIGIYGGFEAGAPVTLTGGRLTCAKSFSTSTTAEVHGGRLDFPGTVGTLNIRGGTVLLRNDSVATITNLFIFRGGNLDASQTESVTVTNCTLYEGATLRDPFGMLTPTNGYDFVGCQPADVTLEVKDSQTWTPSAL